MWILGISAYYHDSAAAIIEDGVIRAAAQEERFTRKKGDSRFPHNAISYCLDACGIDENDLDYIVFYENHIVKFDRLMNCYHLTAPFSLPSFLKSMPSWLTSKLWMDRLISREMGIEKRVLFSEHHLSHAASAFYPSPFETAAILTIDGVGEWSTTTYGMGSGNAIELRKHIRFPNSLGLLYSAFTYYTGFKINSGEYKLMGLAPYGEPKFADLIKEKLVRILDDGSIVLNQYYFDYISGVTMTNRRFDNLFGKAPRKPETLITQFEMDVASSIQQVVSEIILKMVRYVYEETKTDYLVMAGGVALNSVANGLVSRQGPFKKIWIQPAAGDAGGALGAACWVWYHVLKKERKVVSSDCMDGNFLGPEIKSASQADDLLLERMGARWTMMDEHELARSVANDVARGMVVAVARGRMEWGPRALGNRSILGDARLENMQTHMNLKIKFRESFRPFAPMVLYEDAGQYFDISQESPYMLFVYPVSASHRYEVNSGGLFGIDLLKQSRSDIPAVTHIDYSARVQTVDRKRNPFMWDVLSAFKAITGHSVMINTSFNVRGEPIVNTVEDAYRCFMVTDIDCLVAGNRYLQKGDQENRPFNDNDRSRWLKRFDLD
jgi:carbamoyltransferase